MQILLAVDETYDSAQISPPAPTLLKRLQFASSTRVDAVHVIPPALYSVYETEANLAADIMTELDTTERSRCTTMVDRAAARFAGSAYGCRTAVLEGSVVAGILRHADETGADLIAVNGSQIGEAAAFIEGNVVRSLVVDSKCSLLIAKAQPAYPPQDGEDAGEGGPVNVVLATDHSKYAECCIDRFLRFAPSGIGRLMVVTAFPREKLHNLNVRRTHLAISLEGAVEDALRHRNDALVAKLKQHLTSNV